MGRKKRLMYLVSPYTHEDPKIRERLYDYAVAAQAYFACKHEENFAVYSPIAQWHQAAIRFDLPKDASFWEDRDRIFLDLAECIGVVICLALKSSQGAWEEIVFALRKKIPIFTVNLKELRKTGLFYFDLSKEEEKDDFTFETTLDRCRDNWVIPGEK